jgi:hypothetical protein
MAIRAGAPAPDQPSRTHDDQAEAPDLVRLTSRSLGNVQKESAKPDGLGVRRAASLQL